MAARTAPRTGRSQRSSLFGLAPGGVCRASELPRCWCALTAPFHPYRATSRRGLKVPRGGLLSVALSRTLRPADVIGHPVLRSPDFPPAAFATGSRPARLKTTVTIADRGGLGAGGSGENESEGRKAENRESLAIAVLRSAAFRFPPQFALPPLVIFVISTPPESLSPHQARRFYVAGPLTLVPRAARPFGAPVWLRDGLRPRSG